MIDSHCHLADKKFDDDREAVIARAIEAGVTTMITIADSLEESQRCIAIAEKHPEVFCTVGVHPHNAKQWITRAVGLTSSTGSGQRLRQLASASSKVKAIGEIGLDYHYDFSPREVQRDVFRTQLKIARELSMPVVVHCREAVDDVWAIVDEYKPQALVLHCCTEKWGDVAHFADRGYFLSFTGIATYPDAENIRDTIRHCPLSQVMIETDAPYLPPEALRAKGGHSIRNEPSFVLEVAKLIASLKGISLAEVDVTTTRNAVEFFGLPASL